MTTTVTEREAESHFREMLGKVEHGETVEITRDGRTVAKLIAADEQMPKRDPEAIRKAIEEWEQYRDERDITLGGLSIKDLINEGRKY